MDSSTQAECLEVLGVLSSRLGGAGQGWLPWVAALAKSSSAAAGWLATTPFNNGWALISIHLCSEGLAGPGGAFPQLLCVTWHGGLASLGLCQHTGLQDVCVLPQL